MNRYRIHSAVMRPLHFVSRCVRFVDLVVWEWAHYRNPANVAKWRPVVGSGGRRVPTLREFWRSSEDES